MDALIKTVLQGGPGLAAVVFMYIVYAHNRKRELSTSEALKILKRVETGMREIKGTTDWMQDENRTNHLRQDEIKTVIQDLHLVIKDMHRSQERQTLVLEKLVDRIVGIN